jgi:hypothetical protein
MRSLTGGTGFAHRADSWVPAGHKFVSARTAVGGKSWAMMLRRQRTVRCGLDLGCGGRSKSSGSVGLERSGF